MPRSSWTTAAVVLATVAIPAALRAQSAGESNDARVIFGVGAAALGQSRGLSLGVSRAAVSYGGALAVGELPLGPGSFRLVAGHPKDFEAYSVGYGMLVGQHALASFLRTTVGADLSLGYFGYRLPGPSTYIGNGTYTNAHLAVPLGLRLGSANWLSVTPYVAPYAEIGAAPSGYWIDPETRATGQACQDVFTCKYLFSGHHQTEGLGATLGLRLTMWRIAVDAAYRDVPATKEQFQSRPMSLGVSLRF